MYVHAYNYFDECTIILCYYIVAFCADNANIQREKNNGVDRLSVRSPFGALLPGPQLSVLRHAVRVWRKPLHVHQTPRTDGRRQSTVLPVRNVAGRGVLAQVESGTSGHQTRKRANRNQRTHQAGRFRVL